MVQRVTNEVEIQCRLKHPSILEVKLACSIAFFKVLPLICLLCVLKCELCFIVAMVIS